ncbi:sigma-70 family RNA polymerase sigma factor [Candidatus Bipolaricaulota bacterium]|nr:sigma-70 family RNA polymerase sigma factor [Candidatus Bipolaricaulota bacterium]
MTGEERLLARVAAQDRGAFQLLYERYADAVYRYALSILRKPHLAEDVLQETMMAVWKGAKNFKGRSKVTTWMLGITRNQAHNILRKEAKGQRLPASDPTTTTPHNPTQSLHVDLCVQDALDMLSPNHREVMHLVFYENLTVRETAELLKIPTGTVKSRMHHARQALAKELT